MTMRFAPRLLWAAMPALVLTAPAAAQESAAKPAPSPQHRVLQQYVGRWEVTGTLYPEATKSEPAKLKGTEEARFLVNSSWLILEERFRLNDTQSVEAVEIFCYDAGRGKYTTTGAHSAFPLSLSVYEGTYDEASKTLTWEGEYKDAKTGEKIIFKVLNIFTNENTQKIISYVKKSGSKDFVKSYELDCKRVK